jgi:hypothetical protein
VPDTRGKPLPSEVLEALKSPTVQSWLKNYVINQGSAASIGRIPGFESAQNDQYVYPDDADANFAYNFDYVIPSNFQRLVSAKLSFRMRAYRTYSNFSATTTATDSTAGSAHHHGVGIESGHSHSHGHTLILANATGGATVNVPLNTLSVGGGATDTTTVQSNANGSSGHTHGNSADENAHTHSHNHSVTVSSTLGIAEDTAPSNPGITVKVDGADVTASLGGPFNTDQVEIDVTQVLKTGIKAWHTLALQPNQRLRMTGILRISYYVDSRVAQ